RPPSPPSGRGGADASPSARRIAERGATYDVRAVDPEGRATDGSLPIVSHGEAEQFSPHLSLGGARPRGASAEPPPHGGGGWGEGAAAAPDGLGEPELHPQPNQV